MTSKFQFALLSFNSLGTADTLFSNISFPRFISQSAERMWDFLFHINPAIKGLFIIIDLSLDACEQAADCMAPDSTTFDESE